MRAGRPRVGRPPGVNKDERRVTAPQHAQRERPRARLQALGGQLRLEARSVNNLGRVTAVSQW